MGDLGLDRRSVPVPRPRPGPRLRRTLRLRGDAITDDHSFELDTGAGSDGPYGDYGPVLPPPCCHTPHLCGGPHEDCYAPAEGYGEAPDPREVECICDGFFPQFCTADHYATAEGDGDGDEDGDGLGEAVHKALAYALLDVPLACGYCADADEEFCDLHRDGRVQGAVDACPGPAECADHDCPCG